MNKEMFLAELRKKLSGLSPEELEERIAFYAEMIDDRMADGATEEEAVAGIGPVEDIVNQIMSEIPLSRLVGEKVKRRKQRKGWEIVLLVLGAPLWVPLVIAAAVILLSFYIVLWSLVLTAWAVDLSLAAGAVASLAAAIPYLRERNGLGVLCAIGAALACAGLAILMFYVCRAFTAGVLKLSRKILLKIKSCFVGREE